MTTGGWSENEAIIEAIHNNHLIWAVTWNLSERGGYYVFKLEPK